MTLYNRMRSFQTGCGLAVLFPSSLFAFKLVGLCVFLLLLAACEEADENIRAALASQELGPVRVALVWDDNREDHFRKGAELAQDQINGREGISGRPLEFVAMDEASGDLNPRTGVMIGRAIAADPEIVAVIGHSDSKTAISASIIYEEAGILLINPAVTDRSLNEHGFSYVFSTIPDNELIGTQVATEAFSLGYRRIAVLNSRADEAFETTKAFAKQAAALGMTIVNQQSFFDQRQNFRDIIASFGYSGFDALFLAARPESMEAIIRQSMEMNLRTPVILGSMVSPSTLRDALGNETSRITMPILFNPWVDDWRTKRFLREFEEKFEMSPDGWAAQGYDSVMMLADSMRDARSTVPLSVATFIRYTLSWQGITGRHSFDRSGSVYTKTLDFATLENGTIRFLSAEGDVHTVQPVKKNDQEAGLKMSRPLPLSNHLQTRDRKTLSSGRN